MNENAKMTRLAIVDDRSLSVDSLRRAVTGKADISLVFTATNGIDLKEQIELHGAPDVLLLDVEMPVMDGYKTAQWLQQTYPGVCIIAVSIFADPEVITGMLRSGAHGFLGKGASSDTVYHAIKEVAAEGTLKNEFVGDEQLTAATASATNTKHGHESLTDRQIQLLHLCDSDDTFELIADKMYLSVHTVKRYASELYHRFGVHSRTALMREARRLGLLPMNK